MRCRHFVEGDVAEGIDGICSVSGDNDVKREGSADFAVSEGRVRCDAAVKREETGGVV